MKNMILLTALCFLATSQIFAEELACETYETQVISENFSLSSTNGACLVELESFSFFKEHGLCPLFVEDALYNQVKLSSAQCEKFGKEKQIWGVLVNKSGILYLE